MIHQIGIVTKEIDTEVELTMEAGFTDWIRDTATVQITNPGKELGPVDVTEVEVRMAFNNNLMDGVEWEFVQCKADEHYINLLNLKPGDIAHLGIHVDDEEDIANIAEQYELDELVVTGITMEHSRESNGSRWQWSVWAPSRLPHPVKLIRRIDKEEALSMRVHRPSE